MVFSFYPPDSQESDGGAILREAITSTCFWRYRDIAVLLILFIDAHFATQFEFNHVAFPLTII